MNFKKLNEQLEKLIEWASNTNSDDIRDFINKTHVIQEELDKRNVRYEVRSNYAEYQTLKDYYFNDFDVSFYLNFEAKDARKKQPEYYLEFIYKIPEDSRYLHVYKNKLYDWSNEDALKILTKEFLDFYLPILNGQKPAFEDDYIVASIIRDSRKRIYSFGKKFKTVEDIKNAFGQAYDYIVKNEIKDLQDPIWEPDRYWGPQNILQFGPMYYDKENGLSSKEDFIKYNLDYINNTFYNGDSDDVITFYFKKSGKVVLGR